MMLHLLFYNLKFGRGSHTQKSPLDQNLLLIRYDFQGSKLNILHYLLTNFDMEVIGK